jgi:hypothetical protein
MWSNDMSGIFDTVSAFDWRVYMLGVCPKPIGQFCSGFPLDYCQKTALSVREIPLFCFTIFFHPIKCKQIVVEAVANKKKSQKQLAVTLSRQR